MPLTQTVAWPDRYEIQSSWPDEDRWPRTSLALLVCLSCNWYTSIDGQPVDYVIREIHEHNRVHGR